LIVCLSVVVAVLVVLAKQDIRLLPVHMTVQPEQASLVHIAGGKVVPEAEELAQPHHKVNSHPQKLWVQTAAQAHKGLAP
jgi:hypothetical protein